MKSDRRILVAFILNLAFSVIELVGGLWTGSIAICSDALHDLGDAAGIGISYFLEKRSKRPPDKRYSYGYGRYSVLGGALILLILFLGSAAVIFGAVMRLINPVPVKYDGMIVFAVIGIVINLGASILTRDGHSLNQRAVSLHMLEDVLGWAVVLVGALVMRVTDISVIDPIMSVVVSVFIALNAVLGLKEIFGVLLETVPRGIDLEEISRRLSSLEGVTEVHHLHVWTLDGQRNYATLHARTSNSDTAKRLIRRELSEYGIGHVTIEIEGENETCHERNCCIEPLHATAHVHHHH